MKIGKGYRRVRNGEVLKKGDEFYGLTFWMPVYDSVGMKLGEVADGIVRRRIKPSESTGGDSASSTPVTSPPTPSAPVIAAEEGECGTCKGTDYVQHPTSMGINNVRCPDCFGVTSPQLLGKSSELITQGVEQSITDLHRGVVSLTEQRNKLQSDFDWVQEQRTIVERERNKLQQENLQLRSDIVDLTAGAKIFVAENDELRGRLAKTTETLNGLYKICINEGKDWQNEIWKSLKIWDKEYDPPAQP